MPIQFDSSGSNRFTFTAPASGSYTWSWPSVSAANACQGWLYSNGTTLSTVLLGGLAATGFTAAKNTTGTNNSTTMSSLTASGGTANQQIAFVTKAYGAITRCIPDGTVRGGNTRGLCSIDLQITRQYPDQVCSDRTSIILNGQNNKIQGTVVADTSNYILNGSDNSILGGTGNLIVNGANNRIQNGNSVSQYGYNIILNGQYNLVKNDGATQNGSHNTILNGIGCSTRQQFNTVIFGNDNFGDRTLGSGKAQTVLHRLTRATSNTTPTYLTSDTGTSLTTYNSIKLPESGGAVVFWGYVMAAEFGVGTGKKVWEISGLARYAGGVVTFPLAPTITSLYAGSGSSAYVVAVEANSTNGTIDLKITGISTTVFWAAYVYTLETA